MGALHEGIYPSLTNVLTSPIIMTGGLKHEYYIRKRILIFFKFLTNF